MKTKLIQALVTASVVLGLPPAVGAADIEDSAANRITELQKICSDAGGRFERSWLYDDGAARYGLVLTCSTAAGFVACQDHICRNGRWARSPARTDMHVKGLPEPAVFAVTLAKIAGN